MLAYLNEWCCSIFWDFFIVLNIWHIYISIHNTCQEVFSFVKEKHIMTPLRVCLCDYVFSTAIMRNEKKEYLFYCVKI